MSHDLHNLLHIAANWQDNHVAFGFTNKAFSARMLIVQ